MSDVAMTPHVVRVALPVPLWQAFDYLAPARGPAPKDPIGCRLVVPFGRGKRVGVVVGVGDDPLGADRAALREAEGWLDLESLFGEELWRTLKWAHSYWVHPLGEVLATALPAALREARPAAAIAARAYARALRPTAAPLPRAGTLKARVLEALSTPLSESELKDRVPGCARVLRELIGAGLVDEIPGFALPARPAIAGPPLNDAQREAASAIVESFGRFQPFVLDGVTGSGKTEVYIAAIRRAVDAGRQALVLVPEIGLTPQAIRRYRERLGIPIAVLHSGLADGERAAAWLAAGRGEARVVLGTRSAVLTPLPHAGLIVVDEEHDASYKQQDGFRYSARDLAVVRARALGVPVVLGSATPSLETLANVEAGRYRRLRLPTRAGPAQRPVIEVVDVNRKRLIEGLALPVRDAIAEHARRGEQVLVFRNRRGYAPRLACTDCGWHAECSRCDTAMTLHRAEGLLRCHHCGASRPIPRECPSCHSVELVAEGFGTERLEEALAAHLPEVPVLRVDRDTTRTKSAFDTLFERLEGGGPAVLVGTQMLAKGHDLPNLTLAVVVDADAGLASADFRGAERLAQLLVQVSGRAGRGVKPGRVLIQTRQPEHPLLKTLLAEGYGGFARAALAIRKAHALPPFAAWAMVRAEAREIPAIEAFLGRTRGALLAHDGLAVQGPLPAHLARRAGYRRAHLIVESRDRRKLNAALAAWAPLAQGWPEARRVRWSLDVDPLEVV
jgi:primosomal protein N' (replication factor Y)